MAKAIQRPQAAAAGEQEDQPRERFCAVPPHPELALPAGIDPGRAAAINGLANKWVNGTVLHYWFFDEPASKKHQVEVVRKAFTHWKNQNIGLEFVETGLREEAEFRIRFVPGRSWSHVGSRNTEVLIFDPTMNFGWDLRTDWGWATALHEIGHAMGLEHEHQNPLSNLEWNEDRVIQEFAATNGWTREDTTRNILNRMSSIGIVNTRWDPLSIMHYPFGRGLIKAPPPYDRDGTPRNTELSLRDIAFVRELYPPLAPPTVRLQPMMLQRLQINPGEQADFVIEPEISQKYVISTVGPSDSKMVLFEERDGEPRYVACDDDSAAERNARLEQKLIKGRKYILRVRLHHLQSSSGIGVMMV